jgi:hypothetical protein
MSLYPYTSTREGEAHQLGSSPNRAGWALSEEMLS